VSPFDGSAELTAGMLWADESAGSAVQSGAASRTGMDNKVKIFMADGRTEFM
jgi:hypothetical protein